MNIKKIEWVDYTQSELFKWYSATLPFRYHARIIKAPEGWFRWSILQGTSQVVCGMAPTPELAKDDCQAAWEEIVSLALEVEE